MNWKNEWKILAALMCGFLLMFYLPLEWLQTSERLSNSLWEGLYLAQWYAREHLIFCLVPAFFIAGAIGVFVSQGAVMRYLGAGANKLVAYGVASVSGTVLAVCSCTVLPLFAGIYRMGAGLGPATAFLYSGPAINVMAIILTARILGLELGIARAVGAIVFSVVIGLLMELIFRREEAERVAAVMPDTDGGRPLWQTVIFFAVQLAILIFATWGVPQSDTGLWQAVFGLKWHLTILMTGLLGVMLVFWFRVAAVKVIAGALAVVLVGVLSGGNAMLTFAAGIIAFSWITATGKGEAGEWFSASWGFVKQIMPLLLFGVLAAGILLGRPGHEGLIPSAWVASVVGGNSLAANAFAAVLGAFMYFATLTEVPILQGLIGSGMGKGPALALLLAGPALSLPNMLVIRSVLGNKKTAVFVLLVIVMATLAGLVYGSIFA